MNKLNLLNSLLIIITLAGCASMDQSECLTADWRTIGFEDGSQGRPQARIGQYRSDCAEHGVAPDLDAYQRGHLQGAEQFCTSENGFSKGLSGFNYQNSCPGSLELEFVSAYRDGKLLHNLNRQINTLKVQLRKTDARIEEIDRLTLSISAELLANEMSKQERLHLLADLKSLHDEKVYLAESTVDMEYQLSEKQGQYAHARDELSDYFQ